MTDLDPQQTSRMEGRSLTISMWGNLFMGAVGVLAAILSNSQAILVDGLFSLIGFSAALLGKRISRKVSSGPDRYRPHGYAADEAIFVTFRSLSLLGLVLFAIAGAVMNILGYMQGDPTPELIFEPMVAYFVIIGLTCFLLWFFHHRAWRKTGGRSDVLRIEAKAAAFDGFITATAAVGLFMIRVFQDGPLAFIAPIGDSLIVLLLCLTVITHYLRDFMSGLAELAGVTAAPEHIAHVRRAIRKTVAEDGGKVIDVGVSKVGRSFVIELYYDPVSPADAARIDRLTRRVARCLQPEMVEPDVYVIVSEHGRRLPDNFGRSEP